MTTLDKFEWEGVQAEVLADAEPMEYAKNELLIQKGSKPFGLLVIRQGLAGIYVAAPDGEEVLVAPVVPGVVLGARLSRDFTFEFSLRALSSVRLDRLGEDRFRAKLSDPRVATWCSNVQHNNLMMLTGFMSSASQRSTDRKILNFVRTYLEEVLRRPLGASEKAEWLITQSHMSEMLGVTRTHLNARLSALSEQGILDIRRRQIYWRRDGAAGNGDFHKERPLTMP